MFSAGTQSTAPLAQLGAPAPLRKLSLTAAGSRCAVESHRVWETSGRWVNFLLCFCHDQDLAELVVAQSRLVSTQCPGKRLLERHLECLHPQLGELVPPLESRGDELPGRSLFFLSFFYLGPVEHVNVASGCQLAPWITHHLSEPATFGHEVGLLAQLLCPGTPIAGGRPPTRPSWSPSPSRSRCP